MKNSTTGGSPAQSMQERLMSAMRSRLKAANLAAVVQSNWANTGTIYAQDADFHTHLEIAYAFHAGSCQVTLRGPAVQRLAVADNAPTWRMETVPGGAREIRYYALHYADGGRINVLLGQIDALVAKPATAAAPSAQLLQAAQDAFWAVVADHHGDDAVGGDLAPDTSQAFTEAASAAVLAWEQANVMTGIRVSR